MLGDTTVATRADDVLAFTVFFLIAFLEPSTAVTSATS